MKKKDDFVYPTGFELLLKFRAKEKDKYNTLINELIDTGVFEFHWEYNIHDSSNPNEIELTIWGSWADNLAWIATMLPDINEYKQKDKK